MANTVFTWTKIEGLPDDGPVTDLVVAPVIGGPGAVVAFKQNKQGRIGWMYGTTFKLLDSDVYEQDPYQDAAIAAYLGMDGKLYVILSHAFEDVGTSSRLTIGVADAPWAGMAYGLLDNRIDTRALAVAQSLLQGGEAGHADEELRAEIDRLKTEVTSLHGRIGELERLAMSTAEKVHQAGAVMGG